MLAAPEVDGWRLRHSLPYKGCGDIDSIAIAPTGIAFAIKTKTRTFNVHHLASVQDNAVWVPPPPPRGLPAVTGRPRVEHLSSRVQVV